MYKLYPISFLLLGDMKSLSDICGLRISSSVRTQKFLYFDHVLENNLHRYNFTKQHNLDIFLFQLYFERLLQEVYRKHHCLIFVKLAILFAGNLHLSMWECLCLLRSLIQNSIIFVCLPLT